jgi:hypothetical protein
MKRIALGLGMAAVFVLAATVAQAQTCPVAQMISPTNGSTLPAGAVTFEWCNASADYFLTVESVPGAHDIFFAFAGGVGPGAGVVSVTLGPACNTPTPANPTTQCIPANGETIHVTLDTVKSKQLLGSFQYTYTAASPTPTLTLSVNQSVFRSGNALHVGLTAQNPTPTFAADVYFGILLPDGVTACFISSLSPLAGQCLPLTGSPKTFPSLAANIQIPQGLDVTLNDLMVFTFGGGEPPGTYSVFAVLTPAGAFADGSVAPGDIISISVQAVNFLP